MQTTKEEKRASTEDMTIVVRKYEKNSDREEVLKIFRDGMISTIQPGLKEKLINSYYFMAYFCLISSIFFYYNYIVYSSSLTISPKDTIYDDENGMNSNNNNILYWICYILASSVLPYIAISFLSYKIADGYVVESITEKDLKSIEKYYLQTKRSMFWVACIGTEVVGTIALDEIKEGNKEGWKVGDGELRRMSVKKTCRGKGISRQLFLNLKKFCQQKKYKRIVLSTSELQKVACKMYSDSYNFEIEKIINWNGLLNIKYFKLEL